MVPDHCDTDSCSDGSQLLLVDGPDERDGQETSRFTQDDC